MKMNNYPSTTALDNTDKFLVARQITDGFETYTLSAETLKNRIGVNNTAVLSVVEGYTAPVVITADDTTPPENTNALWCFPES